MNKFKLKVKLFLYIISFSFFLLFLLWLFQIVFLDEMYIFIRKQELNNAIELVETNINNDNLSDIIAYIQYEKQILVQKGTDLKLPNKPFNNDDKRPLELVKKQNFTLADGSNITYTFYTVISPVDATVNTLRIQLYIVSLILFISSIIIALILAKKIARPIEEINKNAKLLAKPNKDLKFKGEGYVEIKELANTLNEVNTELLKVDHLRKELIANVSHDLRTPLTLIYSYAEMMNDFPNEITNEQTQLIMDETKRLTTLVNDMLDLSKFENGIMSLNITKFNLTLNIELVVDRLSKLIEKEKITINFIYDNEIEIFADEVMINQVIYNLLINAINYCGDDKEIIIKQILTNDIVRIEVIDHGKGIDQKDMEHIWDRYYKIDKNHRRPVIGTGLGLSIVKKIVSLHNGNYGVNSIKDKGSLFYIELKQFNFNEIEGLTNN